MGAKKKKIRLYRFAVLDNDAESPQNPSYWDANEYMLATSPVPEPSQAEDVTRDNNPCTHPGARLFPACPPDNVQDLKSLAKFFNFKIVRIDGVLHLKTGLKAKKAKK